MKIVAEISEAELRVIVLKHLQEQLPEAGLQAKDVKIEVKSKQNYKSEWEEAAFRARVDVYPKIQT